MSSMITNITWENYGGGVVIQDVPAEHYDAAAEFMIANYKRHPLCHYLNMREDVEALEDLKNFTKKMLSHGTSLMVFNKETKEVMGLAILNVFLFSEKAWVQLHLYPTTWKVHVIINYDNALNKDMREMRIKENRPLDCLHLFYMTIGRKFEGYHYTLKLLMCSYRLAQSMKIPILTFNGYTVNDQTRAQYFGMQKMGQLFYGFYREPDGAYPFKDIKAEYFCIPFELCIEKAIPYDELPPEIVTTGKKF